MSLSGKVICFTGTLTVKRADAKKLAEDAGATVSSTVTAKTTLLVAGSGAGAKIANAKAKGVDVWTEAEFSKACAKKGGAKATAKKAPAAAKKAPPAKRKPTTTAAAAAAPKKAKVAKAAASSTGGGNIPIESGLAASGKMGYLGAAPAVHEDYAWLGNQTNIGANNNKFYRGQVIVNASGDAFSWTRWGRVGEGGQNNLDGPTSIDNAKALFEKKFKDKSGYKWEGGDHSYGEAKTKKYTVIHEKHGESHQGDKLANAGLGGVQEVEPPVKYAEPKITGKLKDFTELVTSSDMFRDQLKNIGVDISKMPLGDISQETVDSGMNAILELEKEYKKKSPSHTEVQRLSSKFYTYIPHNFGRNVPPVLQRDDLQLKKDMLNIISDVGAAVQTQKKTRSKKKGKKVALEPHPVDSAYESLGADLELVDTKSEEFKHITTYTDQTQGYRKCKVVDVFRVNDCANADAFTKKTKNIGNRKLLWHGTNVAVVAAILKSGLRIMPHSGGRVGSGIYLASENGKSAGYTSAHGNSAVMFLVEAALGKQRIITSDGQVGWNEKDPVSKHKADSCWAVGSTEPDPKKDFKGEFEGNEVIIPQGKPINNPALKKHGGSSSYSQSEYLLYNESQVRIRYVIKMRF